MRQKGLRRKPHWKVCRHDSMILGSWHVLLGDATDRLELDSNRVQVAMSPRGHTLKSGRNNIGRVRSGPEMD